MKTTTFAIASLLMLCSLQVSGQDQEEYKEEYSSTHNHFMIDLGMNNYLEDGKSPDSDAPYAVKPWGSWYIALKSINDTHIDGKLHLYWGGDVSWYTFKFEDPSVRLEMGPDELIFITEDIPNAHKSKLNASYLNISAVPMLHFGKPHGHKWRDHDDFTVGMGRTGGFRIGLGAYAGYRLGSKTKYVIKDGDKDKDKDHENFYLNDWRYGIRFQTGFDGFDAFINYDLNELFKDGKGPSLNAISFGVVL